VSGLLLAVAQQGVGVTNESFRSILRWRRLFARRIGRRRKSCAGRRYRSNSIFCSWKELSRISSPTCRRTGTFGKSS